MATELMEGSMTLRMGRTPAYGLAEGGEGPGEAAVCHELGAAELEAVEGGFLFFAGFVVGVALGSALSRC